MANTYIWLVEGMKCYPQYAGKENVVFTVYWRCNGTDGEYTATVYNSQTIVYDPSEKFTPYENLTEKQVLEWLKESMGADQVAEYESNLATQLANIKNPPSKFLPIPWASS
jgi:hypothetical protein